MKKAYKIIILFLLTFFCCNYLTAQENEIATKESSTKYKEPTSEQTAKEQIASAVGWYHRKRFDWSLQMYERAFEYKPILTPINLYNAACSAALCKNEAKAWQYLDLALKKGYSNYIYIVQDTNLVALHKDEKWNKIAKEYKKEEDKLKERLKLSKDLANLVPFKENDLMGYMEFGTKKIIINPMFLETKFSQSLYFEDIERMKDLLPVKVSNYSQAYIGINEILYKEHESEPYRSIQQSLSINFFKENEKWGIKDEEDKVIVKPKYKDYNRIYTKYHNGHIFYLLSYDGTDFFYVDENGIEYKSKIN
jgi:hypothetical protein